MYVVKAVLVNMYLSIHNSLFIFKNDLKKFFFFANKHFFIYLVLLFFIIITLLLLFMLKIVFTWCGPLFFFVLLVYIMSGCEFMDHVCVCVCIYETSCSDRNSFKVFKIKCSEMLYMQLFGVLCADEFSIVHSMHFTHKG